MPGKTFPMYSTERQESCVRRLGVAEGQIRGVRDMIESQRPCPEVLTQLSAAQSALREVSRIVLRNYLETCATNAIRQADPKVYDEMTEIIFRFAE